jgi:hypothetical protein
MILIGKFDHSRGLSLNCSRWYQATNRRTRSPRFRSMWSDHLDCRSDCRSSDARRLTAQHLYRWDRSSRSTYDEPCPQTPTCWKARTQRPMLLAQVSCVCPWCCVRPEKSEVSTGKLSLAQTIIQLSIFMDPICKRDHSRVRRAGA